MNILYPSSIKNILKIALLIVSFLSRNNIYAQVNTATINSDTTNTNDSTVKSPKANWNEKTKPINNNINEKEKKKVFDDSTRSSAKHAALLGLACPGLGQIYNKKYWKLPIVYAGISGCIFWVARQASKTKEYNQYLVLRANSAPLPAQIEQLSTSRLESIRNGHRRNVQIASFVTLMVWGFSILDAAVDAHIKPFDVSDNLSMQIKPTMLQQNLRYYAALQINLNLK